MVWQCFKVLQGRRNGARIWQKHFLACITDATCPGQVKQNFKAPSLSYSQIVDVLLGLHEDDGYTSGPAAHLEWVCEHLSKVPVIKVSPLVLLGMAFDHVGTTRSKTDDGMWIQSCGKYVSKVLEIMGMQDCNPSTSPKLDRAHMEGDDDPCEKAALFRTGVCTFLYVPKRQPEIQSTVRWLCKRLKNPTKKAWQVGEVHERQPELGDSLPYQGPSHAHRWLRGRRLGLR
jgi:hypothetical protein